MRYYGIQFVIVVDVVAASKIQRKKGSKASEHEIQVDGAVA